MKDFAPSLTSVSSNSLLVASVADVLEQVERLPSGATGALRFGARGVILVENKRICWAVAEGMRPRLTDILCRQQRPPLDHARVEEVYRTCRERGTPLAKELVDQGLVSETGLRAAMERHTCEALVRIAQNDEPEPPHFENHRRDGYRPDFVFGPAELLASLSGRRRTDLVSAARYELARQLLPEAQGLAFMCEANREPALLAVGPGWDLSASAALAIARWVSKALDLARYVDAGSSLMTGTWCERMSLVAWRREDIGYAALCTSRPASARLITRLVACGHAPAKTEVA